MPRSSAALTDYDVLIKAVVIGDSGVGKSSLLHRFTDDRWDPAYISTIGVDFAVESVERDGKLIKFQLWDTAGQERFRTITTSYYRGAHAVMLVYDVTDRDSFAHVPQWARELRGFVPAGGVPMLLVANKCDLASLRAVSAEEGAEMAAAVGAGYAEASAQSSAGVAEAFHALAAAALPVRLRQLSGGEDDAAGGDAPRRRPLSLCGGDRVDRHSSCLRRFAALLGV